MSAVADVPVPDRARHAHRRVPGPVPGTARSADALLRHARIALSEAEWQPDAAEKFSRAYLAGLRGAAAMLALRGRPHRGRARPTSAWVLLAKVAPELSEWATFFAAHSATSAAVQAGIGRAVSQRSADDLARQTAQFLAIVRRALDEQRQRTDRSPG